MKVTVKFFTTLREITQKREEEIQLSSAATVEELLKILSKKYGRKFTDYVYDSVSIERKKHNHTTRP